jgi:hypothetical protein
MRGHPELLTPLTDWKNKIDEDKQRSFHPNHNEHEILFQIQTEANPIQIQRCLR